MRRNFQRASSSSSPAIPKKKKLWPRRQKLQLFFFISLKMQLQISVLFSLSSSHFFQLTTVSTNDILQRESLESDSKKKYRFSGRPRSILIEYILPTTRFLKKKIALPFFKSDLSHQVLEFQNSVKYMLGIYTSII